MRRVVSSLSSFRACIVKDDDEDIYSFNLKCLHYRRLKRIYRTIALLHHALFRLASHPDVAQQTSHNGTELEKKSAC